MLKRWRENRELNRKIKAINEKVYGEIVQRARECDQVISDMIKEVKLQDKVLQKAFKF